MFIVTTVEDGLTTVKPVKRWSGVIPMLQVRNKIRRLSVREDGKLILLVKRKESQCFSSSSSSSSS